MNKANIMKLFKAILVLCLCNPSSANNEFCKSPEVEFNGLVHPLIKEIKNQDIERFKGFDEEDLDFYTKVRLYVHKVF